MKEKPRNIKEPLLNKSFTIQVLIGGFIISVGVVAAFLIGLDSGDPVVASTMAFATLCLSRLFHSFNCRSNHSIFQAGIFTNGFVWGAVILGIILLALVIFVPGLMGIFEVTPLTSAQYWSILGLSLMPLVVIQLYKLIFVR
jgi:Ca2+-transporting ATPase